MEEVAGMSKLVELIFGKKSTISEQTVEDSSIHAKWLTEDFSKRLHDVLFFKKFILFHGWQELFDKEIHKMLYSHREYLLSIMLLCFCEFELTRNTFDRFLNVSAMVIKWNEKILEKTGLNFNDLNPDIFMIFYRKVLKSYFKKSRDFYRLVEYIRDHKYLKWNRNRLILADDPTTVFRESNAQIKEELSRSVLRTATLDGRTPYLANALCLAQEALSTISIEFPTLPNESDLIKILVETRKREMAKKVEIKKRVEAHLAIETPHKYSNAVDKTNYFETKQEDITRYENIIQAVIRHNNSKNAGSEDDQSLEKADGIIKHLKDSIKSLTEVLDECSKNE